MSNWFGVRTIYQFGKKQDGKSIFEERVVVFASETPDAAIAKAEREGDDYATFHGMQRHSWVEAYEQDGDSLIDAYEVWSVLYEAYMDLDTFVRSRYSDYDYTPDP